MISLNLRHPLGKATTLLLLLFSAILWTSCDEKEKPLSSENLIVSLSLNDGDKEYAAKISSETLSVELPSGSVLPTEVTISLLELSLKANASTSLNSKLTLAGGRATITVTAENKATKEYTLIVTVKKNAVADLKSLSVATGGKSYTATLSNSQASVLLPASVDVPAFVTVASLEVSGQARASVTVGGRIDLTNGTGSIVVTAEDGTTTRSYTLEVRKEEANQANLFALSIRFGETVYEAVISGDVATFSGVSRSMTSGTITAINISEGARSSATVDDALSFTGGEGQLTITASDGQTRKTITVKLEGAALSTEAELSALSLTIGGVTYVATVSGTVATVLTPQVVTSASIASLAYATGATSSVEQGGALTFAGGVSTITITAADGKTTKVYQIVLAKEGDFLTSFSFQVADNSYTSPYTAFATSLGRIDQTTTIIEVELSPYLRGVELASLVPSFTTIGGATVVVGTVAQESGVTPNDFSGDVVYTLSLAGTSKQYTVSVGLSNLAWIPDANFRAKLKTLSLAGAFTQNDSLITDHGNVTGLSEMGVIFSSISSMMGIEFFTGLTYLACNNNQLTALDVSKNIALTNLRCNDNQLTALDVSKNIALTSLRCYDNQLTALDVSRNIVLTGIGCGLNQLTSLDVSKNIALTILNCGLNRLTSLDVSKNTGLTELDCSSNQLTSLDVAKNIALTELYCYSNDLTVLDVAKNTALSLLNCYTNQLTALDVSKNIALTYLDCNSNQLTALDLLTNTVLQTFYCDTNQLTSLNLRAQQSWANLRINAGETVNDVVQNPLTTLHVHQDVKDHGEVLEAKQNLGGAATISTYNTAGNVECEDYDPIGQNCTDGYFLKSFSIDLASNNLVTTFAGRTSLVGQIDYVPATKTVTVFVSPYEKEVDLNTPLKASFNVQSGATVTVGGVAQTSGVTPNSFSAPVSYSVSSGGTTQQYTVSVKKTNLAWIPDANFRAKLKGIQYLARAFTQNDSLITDHSSVTALKSIVAPSSSISSMVGLEFFTALTDLNCASNQLTVLDLTKNTGLTDLRCESNELTVLDVTKNTGLTDLSCHSNELTALDVSKHTGLRTLHCHFNDLTALDVSKNTGLRELNCRNNQLTVLDMSKNTALTIFYCSSNQLTSLDVSKNTGLTTLSCHSNDLTSLDLTKNTGLTDLYCESNELTALDVSKNTGLTTLYCYSNDLTNLDVSKNIGLTSLRCYSNDLTNLDVTKNIDLTQLRCNNNQLTSLDVSQNIALTTLYCHSNQLTSLNVSKNTELGLIDCSSNQLTNLDVRAQRRLVIFAINAGETVDGVVKNPLTTLHVHEAVKDHAEFIESKTNRVDALTISTYNTAGGAVCNNYDPRDASRGCKD